MKCSWNCFNNYLFSSFSTHFTSSSLQVENCDSNSRLVVDEDDNDSVNCRPTYDEVICVDPPPPPDKEKCCQICQSPTPLHTVPQYTL